MKRFFKNRMFVSVLFSAVLTFVFVFAVAYSATTISTDISTGALTASGISTLTGAVTTGAALTVGTNLTVTNNSAVGTVTSGTWNGTVIGTSYGGTGLAVGGIKANYIPFGNGSNAMATSTGLYFTSSASRLTATYASTTALSATNIDATTYTSGTWNGTIIAPAYGGTGWASLQANTVLLGNSANAIATTTAGTNGFVLALSGGVPTWLATTTLTTITGTLPVASGGTNITSYTAGDILYASGVTTLTKLGKGTADQVLQMNAGATAPEWDTFIASLSNTSPWTALQNFSAGASTTLFSTYGPSYFGATATSSFSSAGVLSLISPLAVTSGGTGWASLQANTVLLGNSANAIATTTAGTNGFVLALSGGVPTWLATTTLSSFYLPLTGGTMAGTLAMGAQNITMTGSLGETGAGKLTKGWFTDVESTSMPTVNGSSLSLTFAPIASPSFTGTFNVGGLATTTLNGVVQLVATTTAPGACTATLAGGLAYYSTYGKLCLCNGTAWVYATSSDGAACGTW